MDNSGEFWLHAFESLVADLPEPAFVVDADGDITHWNQAVENILGLPASEAVGMNAYDVFGTEGQDETLAQEVIRTGEPVREGSSGLGSQSVKTSSVRPSGLTERWRTRERWLFRSWVPAGTLSVP